MRIVVALIAVIGTLVCGGAFVTSVVDPVYVETVARDVVKHEVERRVGEKLAAFDDSAVGRLARRVAQDHASQVEAMRQKVLPLIATIMEQMRDPDCACRNPTAQEGSDGWRGKAMSDLLAQGDRLAALIRAKYRDVAGALTREFRIFTGANALMFLLLAGVVAGKPRARLQLLPTAFVLVGATVIAAYFYLFQQNWLHTIVFGDYTGFAYFGYLAVAAAFLGDLAFNRARVTTTAINGVGSVFGSATVCVPC